MSVDDTISYKRFTKNDINSKKKTPTTVRVRKELSLKEKLEILKQYDQLPQMSQRSAAVKLNISQPVLCKILKNRNFIENIMRTNENSVRKRTRGGKEREIESALKVWCVEVQKKNIPINGHIIREKAKELAREMGKEFAATDGWFTRWRKRENIVYNTLFRRKFTNDKDYDCYQNNSGDCIPWVDRKIHEGCQVYSDANGNDFSEASRTYDSEQINSESTVPGLGESKNSEAENICEVFIKTEPEEFENEEKSNVNVPTDEEMLQALRILHAGVKHRTNDLQLHYEYELFIYDLLKKIV